MFGQAGFEVSDRLTLTAGVRYTDDDKDLLPVVTPVPVAPVNVSDQQVSWDLSAVFEASDTVNYYARVASGFRAPTIQGRDIAFFSPPSVASSETILSYEAGVKSDLMDRQSAAQCGGVLLHHRRSAILRDRRAGQFQPAGQCR